MPASQAPASPARANARNVSSAAVRFASSAIPRSTDATWSFPSIPSQISRPTTAYRSACRAAISSASSAASSCSRAYSRIVSSIRRRPFTFTSALSTSDSISSRPASQTASASATVQPPAKTARRRNARCSRSSSSEWLQSIVARSVCCRPGVSREAEVSRSSALSSRSRSASGVRSRSRAAASSSASGSPSSRRQMASTTASLAGVSVRGPGRARRRARRRHPLGSGESGYSHSAAIRSGVLLVATIRSSGHASTSRATSGAAA